MPLDRTTLMTPVPAKQLAGLAKALERIGSPPTHGKGKTILDQTGEDKPTYGDVTGLADDAGTFDLALRGAGVTLPAGKVGKLRLVVAGFGPHVPVCGKCGDLAVDVIGPEAIVRSAGQACPGCGEYLEETAAAKPYVAWTTGREVPPTITIDFDIVPGARIPLTDDAVRAQYAVEASLDALLREDGVELTGFLLWLFHGPQKVRFAGDPIKALKALARLSDEAGHANVVRNWTKAAKGFRVDALPPSVGTTANVSVGWNFTPTKDWTTKYDSRCPPGTSLAMLFEDLGRQIVSEALSAIPNTKGIVRNLSGGFGTFRIRARACGHAGSPRTQGLQPDLPHARPCRPGPRGRRPRGRPHLRSDHRRKRPHGRGGRSRQGIRRACPTPAVTVRRDPVLPGGTDGRALRTVRPTGNPCRRTHPLDRGPVQDG